jgi:hypothetical protein
LEPLFEELTFEENNYAYFQKDNEPTHTTENSMWEKWTAFNE